MSEVHSATQVANEKARPRILQLRRAGAKVPTEYVEQHAGTYEEVYSLSPVALLEWDVLVAHTDFDSIEDLPSDMAVFCVISTASDADASILPISNRTAYGRTWLRWQTGVAGREVRLVSGLPEAIQDLVAAQLVSVADARRSQAGLDLPIDLESAKPYLRSWRPFLIGPENLALAGSFVRKSGAPVWVVPSDLPNLDAWFGAALDEWSTTKPKTFPSRNVWTADPRWMSPPEADVHRALKQAESELEAARASYALRREALENDLATARGSILGRRRALLTDNSESLQSAVLEGLRELGFSVEDMDPTWDPNQLLEDYHITAPNHPGWMALGEATGTANGAKYSKFTALQTHAAKYLVRERPDAVPPLWLVINQLRHRAPEARGNLFTQPEADAIAAAGGLAIDTCALFVLIQWCDDQDPRRDKVREWLISSTGQISLSDADAWIADSDSANE